MYFTDQNKKRPKIRKIATFQDLRNTKYGCTEIHLTGYMLFFYCHNQQTVLLLRVVGFSVSKGISSFFVIQLFLILTIHGKTCALLKSVQKFIEIQS